MNSIIFYSVKISMGINNLHKFLKKHCDNIYVPRHLSTLGTKTVAIDTSLYMYKFKACYNTGWLASFLNLVAKLRKYNIHCIFIYDNGCPEEKLKEREERAEHRNKLQEKALMIKTELDQYYATGEVSEFLKKLSEKNTPDKVKRLLTTNTFDVKSVEQQLKKVESQIITVTKHDFDLTRELFEILSIPYANAHLEAEKTCAQMCYEGTVDYVLSEDTDVLAYNSPHFLTKLDLSSDICMDIDIKTILETIDMTYDQFRDLCIMCGTDYNTNIPRLGPETAYNALIKHKSIEGIGENEPNVDISILNHIRVRELFSFTEPCEVKMKFCGQPDFDKLDEFIFKNNLRVDKERVKKCFEYREIIFEDE